MQAQVLNYLLTIPKGKVVTYGQIAEAIGCPGGARAVGNALHKNPDGNRYPCYKVVNSKGELSGRFAFGGITVQQEKLEADGIKVINSCVDLAKYQFHP
jgi:O-6-methylguanine DNA methyltransferase